MSIALTTTITNDYIPALFVLVKSIYKNTSKEFDFVVFEEEQISEENKCMFKEFKNIIFKPLENKMPTIKNDGRRKWNINPNNRFSIFNLNQYDRIIFLDSDMICLSNIDELLDLNISFGAVYHPYPDGLQSNNLTPYSTLYKGFNFEKSFNAGLMIIDKKYLNDNTINNLISISKQSEWLGNQGPLNVYFNNKVTLLPDNYFLSTPFLKNKDLSNIKFLHFGGDKKPWLTNSMDIYENYSDFVIRNVAINMGPLGHMVLLKILYKYKKLIEEIKTK